jgi:glycosyltransferase involved in cell wall biosynthesis
MIVTHITPVYAPAWQFGGTVAAISQLNEALVRKGVTVRVLTTTFGQTFESAACPVETRVNGVPVEYHPSRKTFAGVLSPSLEARASAIPAADAVFHVSSGWQPVAIRVLRDAYHRRIPYVYSPHGSFAPEVFRKSRWKKWPYYQLYERRQLAAATALHATSPLEADELAQLVPGAAIDVIPNICSGTDWFPDEAGAAWRQQRGISENETVFLQVARLDPIKNTAFLIDALSPLCETARWKLVLIGPGMTHWLQRTAAAQRLLEHRRLICLDGVWSKEDLRAAYAAANVVMVPSRHECFGNVVYESLLCGTPVVASDRVGAALSAMPSAGVITLPLSLSVWRKWAADLLAGVPVARVMAGERDRLLRHVSPEMIALQFASLYERVLRSKQ